MTVETILKRKGAHVYTIDEDASSERAVQLMCEHKIGALIVVRGERIVGTLSHREIVEGLSRHRTRLSTVRVSELVRHDVVSVSPYEQVKSVMSLMTRHRATHIPVLSSERLVGIVSIGDIVKHRLEELELEANVLRDAYITAHQAASVA